ncbi:transcriptional regulator [Bordetella bronchiseptica]|uniref:CII family transcriptional regulator n=1 Tax=Bordetella bronchiseptica TaxID=518 RepID=UPI0005286B45|nr:CII family transcriptional regulator [Bordetella bronchiseptica]AZW22938.1 transcriptional regulator [Bordetella bronchiseptica]
MNAQPVSSNDVESTRKIGARLYSEFLQRLADVTQERAADFMGASASTVSRMKEDVEKVCHLLAAIDFQLAPSDAVVVDQREQQAIESLAFKYLQARQETWKRKS